MSDTSDLEKAEAELLKAIGEDTMEKAQKPPAGYQAIPKGKHGGYRKQTAGGYEYWYPESAVGGASLRKGLERDLGDEGLPFGLSELRKSSGTMNPSMLGIAIPPESIDSILEENQDGGNGGIDEVEDKEQARQQVYLEPETCVVECIGQQGGPFGRSH